MTKEGGEITGELILNKAAIKNNPTSYNSITNVKFIYDLLWETIVLNEIKNSLAYYKIDKALTLKLLILDQAEKYLIFLIKHSMKIMLNKMITP